jgi:hypothetical protein
MIERFEIQYTAQLDSDVIIKSIAKDAFAAIILILEHGKNLDIDIYDERKYLY